MTKKRKNELIDKIKQLERELTKEEWERRNKEIETCEIFYR